MATYNPIESFFFEQIQSLRGQTYSNWICIIVDDCSQEENFYVILSCIKGDSRFQVVRNAENIGSVRTFERGLQLVPLGAEFISFCDQDDIWSESKLEKMLQCFADESVSLVHCDLELIDSVGTVLNKSCWKSEGRYVTEVTAGLLLFRNVVTGCAMMFRREILKSALPFRGNSKDERSSYYHDVWIALHSTAYGEVFALPESLIKYRQHQGNLVGGGRVGKGLHASSLMKRSLSLYRSRENLKRDFILSLGLSARRSLTERKLKYLDNPISLFVHGLLYCAKNPMFIKTLGLLFLGALLSRKRGP